MITFNPQFQKIMTFLKFNWAPNEKLFEIGGFGIHIYSMMFIIAFLVGLRLYKKMFIKEKVDQKYLEPLFIYMVISTLLGARLGEVFLQLGLFPKPPARNPTPHQGKCRRWLLLYRF